MISTLGRMLLVVCLALTARQSVLAGSRDGGRREERIGAQAAQGEPLPAGAIVRMKLGASLLAPEIAAVAFSPDGKILASAGYDKTIRFWEAKSGKEIRSLRGHRDWVSSVTFSPDGKTLASGSRDWTVRLWEVATGKELHSLEGPQGGVLSVAFSPDGKLLLAGCQDKAVYMWEAATGEELFRSRAHLDWVTSVAFSPDGKTMASASWDGTLRLRDTATRKEPRPFGKGHGRFLAMTFAPGGDTLATVSQNKGISLWEVATGKELRSLGEERPRALCLAFSPDGKTLAAGSKDGTIRRWEVGTGKELPPLGESQYPVLSLAFSPSGKSLASGSRSTSIFIWDVAEQLEQPAQGVRLTSQEMENLWADLPKANAPRAHRAMWMLVHAPEQSVSFLQKNLHPVTVDEQRIIQLVGELDSPKFPVRRSATQELEKFGKYAEPALRQALQASPTLEVRKRVERLLARVEGERWVPYADALRAGRALKVLTRIDTPESRRLLQLLAQGSPQSWLTHEAKASLERLRVLGQRP